MNSIYMIIIFLALTGVVIVQIVRMSTYILKLRKSNELNRVRIREEKDWEFIKGLY